MWNEPLAAQLDQTREMGLDTGDVVVLIAALSHPFDEVM